MGRQQTSLNFQTQYGLGKNEADVLDAAPFMVNIIAQLLQDQ